jgi:hypothetical protein
MRRSGLNNVGTILCLLLFIHGCTQRSDGSQGVAVDREDDEAAIRALVAANIAAGNARDPVAVQETYLPGGDAWIAGLARVSTRAELIDAEAEFQALPGFQGYDGEIDSIRFISQDAAIAELSATTILDTGEFDEETTLVLARTELGWKIAAWRVMTFDQTLLELLRE